MALSLIVHGSFGILIAAMAACSSASQATDVSDAGGTASGGATAVSVGAGSGGKASLGGTGNGGRTNAEGATSASGSVPVIHGSGGSAGGTSAGPGNCHAEGDLKTTLVFVNGCADPVSFRGSDITGGILLPGDVACVDIGTATEPLSSKRYWGWIGSDPGSGRHTLAEFTFNTDFYDLDWYNISHVDAHNLPLAIVPLARPKCRQLSCPEDFLATCPAAGQFKNLEGSVVSCVSPDRDNSSSPVALLFEQCDDAYAWSGDDQNGSDVSPMIGCQVEDFEIVFCPRVP